MIKHIITRLLDRRYLPTHGFGTGFIAPPLSGEIVLLGDAHFQRACNDEALFSTQHSFAVKIQRELTFAVER